MSYISFLSQVSSATLSGVENVSDITYLPIVVPIVGALSAQAFAFWLKYRADLMVTKRKATADLHQEFNSPAMSKIRNEAWNYACERILLEMDTKSGHDAMDTGDKTMNSGDKTSLLSVMRFYHRLALLRKENALTDELILPWFGRLYVWWYIYYFDTSFKKWAVHQDLQELFDWMRREARNGSYSLHQSETWNAWVEDALAERDEDIKKHGGYPPDEGKRYL